MSLRTAAYTLRRVLNSREAMAASLADLWPARDRATTEVHVCEALGWLARAQDASTGGAVSYGYDVHAGWLAPYPETTGYIITTVLRCAAAGPARTGWATAELEARARRMADWLLTVQMASGALPGGTTAIAPLATVFNTGQVLEGWCAAHRHRPDTIYQVALTQASKWLTSIQDGDGCWRKYLSPLTVQTPATYNVRSAAALLLAGKQFDEARWVTAALRNFDWALTQQADNGWFDHNCLTDHARPLTHTIGYTLEALLDAAELSGREDYIAAVRRASDHLIGAVRDDGFLAGRFDAAWRPVVRWSCLTGSSQLALVWFRLSGVTGDPKYATSARRAIGYVRATQKVGPVGCPAAPGDGIRGGIKGSHPIWGGYDPFRFPNWATKFFIDALLAEPR